ncbi:MAG: hypothetical protein AMK69_24980 [Nitrospira bacterium SG8_3]|nr:MAG: hypothetical protein AMK69_24980 [Nitrospira bacterium SG8_3]
MKVHEDFKDFIETLNKNNVEYVIVGAFALAFHGHPRATGDIDIWLRPTSQNANAVLKALNDFGFGELDISEGDILSGKIIQLGHPPVRIDLITLMEGVTHEEIWDGRLSGTFGDQEVFYIGRDEFIRNKKAIGRHKDLADLELLGE